MATNLWYICSVCMENGRLTDTDIHCQNCGKYYCDECLSLHNQMYKKHTTHGIYENEKWPGAKGVEELFTQCKEHGGNHIKKFCKDHSQLCCSTCVLIDHRHCNQVTQISSKQLKKTYADLQKLKPKITDTKQRLQKLIEQREWNIQSLEDTYEYILEEIDLWRQKINKMLDSLMQRTIEEGNALFNNLQETLQTEVDQCKKVLQTIQSLHVATDRIGRNDSELCTIAFMKIKKQLSFSDALLRKGAINLGTTLSFTPIKALETYLLTMTTFGNIVSNHSCSAITIEHKQQYNVKLSGESACMIRGICEMPNGNIIIADDSNKKVKMLDKNYRVICQCVLSSSPVSVCKISDDSLAAAVYDWTNFHEINFLAVTSDENLVKTSAFTLNHPCTGVCHNMGLLYITSRTALYRYTLTGTLVDKMYEDTSNFNTVFRCALNTREDKIYVLNWAQQQVLTLNMFGQVLTSFTDPELETPYDVHVSESGHVLIAGYSSKIIIQLNSKGTKKIDHVVSLKEGNNILSVCVLKRTGSILVGSYGTDEILVFNTK